jgi:DNA mismatch repair protein MutS
MTHLAEPVYDLDISDEQEHAASSIYHTRMADATPMMQQYLEIKTQHPDSLLFYRMGDFYELFFEDALAAAEILDIALTKRGKNGDEDIPMCGVPHHSHEPYLQKLIASGQKVVVCEQMETPEEAKKRGYKAVVRREVVRIVTPGTIFEENLLHAKEANYLGCLAQAGKELSLAWVDMSTGEFFASRTTEDTLSADLSRLQLKELLIADKLFVDETIGPLVRSYRGAITPQAASMFDSMKGQRKLTSYYQVETLEAYGQFSRADCAAAGALVEYLDVTQKGSLPRLNPPQVFARQHYMLMDAATARNLELTQTLSGERKGSLMNVIDKTLTASGGRLLRQYLLAPLADAHAINERLDRVQFFLENRHTREQLREALRNIPDMERALCRISMGRGYPRDLAAIREAIRQAVAIRELVEFCGAIDTPPTIYQHQQGLGSYDELQSLLDRALQTEIGGGLARDGSYIRNGYHPRLDELRDLSTNRRAKIDALLASYKERTGANTLKIKQNNVLGYFVEVTPQHADKLSEDPLFHHRQSLASAIRFTTEELRELESNINNAREEALHIEQMIFDELVTAINDNGQKLAKTAYHVAVFDISAALAELANDIHYTRPTIDQSTSFSIEGGRHPVVERTTEKTFTANDCDLSDAQRLWLLTGPNMAGKSTFLRQNALITILAQIGSYVPATSAHIGVVDKVFSRVGASDDLARGRSTFMVEMVETATILNQATKKSLVILDEIGRGTATFDGLSIAWATVEFLHNQTRCRGLFATHYHELTTLTEKLPSLTCATLKVKEWQGDVIFLHEVEKGKADRSYGIHVARLAGLPSPVLSRAEEILHMLESSDVGQAKITLVDDLPLFALASAQESLRQAPESLCTPTSSPVEKALADINPDDLSPKQAWEWLYKLKELS